ncbi:hypothetical protein CAEBREN_19185 [Caenorhabditis brenneri]|uniref:Uncharacterized protein n=1 Tax=Caenorhabditis brenneri TaxID=135651 RepID=G0N3S1_CAEBE|nr:hypothetical protein CAEBREN_19185 [Caenorhabditis brenneri]
MIYERPYTVIKPIHIDSLREGKSSSLELGVDPGTQLHTDQDLKQISEHWKDYHICVWSQLPGVDGTKNRV